MHVVTSGKPGSADRAAAEPRLQAVADELASGAGMPVTQAVLEWAPAAAVLDYAKRNGADLVALGSHGYGLWKRLSIGSVASKVLRLATMSVLVVPIGAVASPG
ncbi:MAG TPA: universal stress protein [Gemmatimonadales bacterium]|nr:universal stress protein [Gemmatimonadales bacterium]